MAVCESADHPDPNAVHDVVAEANERAAILQLEGEMPQAEAERMAERQYGLESGTLAESETRA